MALKIHTQGDATTIYLYDVISEDYGASPKEIVQAIQAAESFLEIRINSPGGDAWGGQAIYNALRDASVPSVATIDGLAASAATMAAIGADRVEMRRGTNFMVHKAWTVTVGDDEAHERALKPLRSGNQFLAEAYAEKTGKTVDEMLAMMSAESWFSADEAVAAGFADAVADSVGLAAFIPEPFAFRNTPEGLEVAAHVRPDWIPNADASAEDSWRDGAAARERLVQLAKLKMY